jgi:hypothetical protein
MTGWLHPDAHQVTLEEPEGKAYYDNERKRWIFPGQDPDEVAKPIGAPPTTPGAGMPAPRATQAEEPKAELNDPLAAMMAPPQRRTTPSSFKRPETVGAVSSPRGYTGASPMAGAPPQFAVFQPKAASKDE